jgi:hypothetical protein
VPKLGLPSRYMPRRSSWHILTVKHILTVPSLDRPFAFCVTEPLTLVALGSVAMDSWSRLAPAVHGDGGKPALWPDRLRVGRGETGAVSTPNLLRSLAQGLTSLG